MKLLNGYKVIYNSKRDGDLHLYSTKQLPAANDINLTYVNDEGYILTAEDIKAIKLCYSKNDHLYYSVTGMPAEDDHRLSCFCEDELVFGDDDITPGKKAKVEIAAIANCVITGAGKYEANEEVKITIAPAVGYKFAAGNAPACDKCTFVEESGKFVGTFTVSEEEAEAEAEINISITGVVVEEKPVAEEGYWFTTAEKGTEIIASATAIKKISKPEQTVVYPGSPDINYLNFAVRKDLGELVSVYNGDTPADVLDTAFDKIETSFNGENYYLYVGKEEHISENEDPFYFCFSARN